MNGPRAVEIVITAPVAQQDRARRYERRGPRFDSSWGHLGTAGSLSPMKHIWSGAPDGGGAVHPPPPG
jgi:hypothetical protein